MLGCPQFWLVDHPEFLPLIGPFPRDNCQTRSIMSSQISNTDISNNYCVGNKINNNKEKIYSAGLILIFQKIQQSESADLILCSQEILDLLYVMEIKWTVNWSHFSLTILLRYCCNGCFPNIVGCVLVVAANVIPTIANLCVINGAL